MKELKSEISRLARGEIRKNLAPVKRINAAQRGWIATLRRQVAALQKELQAVRKAMPPVGAAPAVPANAAREAGARFWIMGKGVRALRKRLGLTQTEFGKLVGVSIATVVNWERASGKVAIRRKETVGQLRAIRTLNKRTAAEQLKKRAKA
jgi:hypothetical protein